MRVDLLAVASFIAVLCAADPVYACPVCNSDTGVQIRALAFGPNFFQFLGLTVAPIPALIAVVVTAHWVGPRFLKNRTE